ncbi:MAG: nucleotidyltransferase domain-containing protein [Elusimicrobiota bacterium]
MNIIIERIVNGFILDLNKLNRGNIHSVYVYGSAVGRGYIHKRSDINVLVILKDINSSFLENNSKLVKKYAKKYKLIPLFLTDRHIQTSQDVFPMEFTEIKDAYILLHGDDILKDLKIDMANIRLQCEQLIKGQLIRIYQILLEIGSNKRKKLKLLINSIGNIAPALRAMLRITGKTPPSIKKDMFDQFAKEYNIDAGAFLEVLKIKESKGKAEDVNALITNYIKALQDIAGVVDGLQV